MHKTSVILLNWEEFNVSLDSVRNIVKEREATGDEIEIIFVDNGSDDYCENSQELNSLLTIQTEEELMNGASVFGDVVAPLFHNYGPSVGRNIGLDLSSGDRIFLLDGDIEYVPGTVALYNELFDALLQDFPNLKALGYNDPERISRFGYNGTKERAEAEQLAIPRTIQINHVAPIAWTQYGLFDGDTLRRLRFIEEGVFGEPGHGYEDDWLHREIEAKGGEVLAVNFPLYYHDANKGLRNLKDKNVPDKGGERRQMFFEKWGDYGFVDRLRNGTYDCFVSDIKYGQL